LISNQSSVEALGRFFQFHLFNEVHFLPQLAKVRFEDEEYEEVVDVLDQALSFPKKTVNFILFGFPSLFIGSVYFT